MKVIRAKKLQGFFEKSIGLIGKKRPEPVVFETRFGIHTYGVRFPVDVVVLNSQNTILKLKTNLRPNCFFFWGIASRQVLELPNGLIKKNGLRLGAKVQFKN